jgi:intein-encoded DNA endonuclease-like protein
MEEGELVNLYWNHGLSLYEIAGIYGAKSHEAIRYRNRAEATALAVSIKPKLEWSHDLAYVVGVCLGDGSVFRVRKQRRFEVQLHVDLAQKLFVQHFAEALSRIGLHPKIYIGNRLVRVRAISKDFYKWFKNLELADILKLPLELKLAFLRGFYESEGGLDIRKGGKLMYAYMDNSRLDLLNIIGEILSEFRFRYRIRTKTNGVKRLALLRGTNETKRFLNLIKPVVKVPEYYLAKR